MFNKYIFIRNVNSFKCRSNLCSSFLAKQYGLAADLAFLCDTYMNDKDQRWISNSWICEISWVGSGWDSKYALYLQMKLKGSLNVMKKKIYFNSWAREICWGWTKDSKCAFYLLVVLKWQLWELFITSQ